MNFISLVGPLIKREWWEEEENVSPEALVMMWKGLLFNGKGSSLLKTQN